GGGGSTNVYGRGGSYGGEGGDAFEDPIHPESVYGSLFAPTGLGSGGGVFTKGARGGGAIRLSVAGELRVDGLLSANGANGPAHADGGGSGGSVWAQAATFSGAGLV